MRLVHYSQTSLALGSDVTLSLVSEKSPTEMDTIFHNLWHSIYTFERAFSRFIPMSELSIFNRSAGVQTPITSAFKSLLQTAKSISIATNGLYNPFILPALQKSGYKRSAVSGYKNDPTDDFSRRHVGAIDQLTIGSDWAVIPFDTALDMGGCGKGYLADQLGHLLADIGISNYRLELGGDIITRGTDESGDNWYIGIQDANNLSGELPSMIKCPRGQFAIATSGTFRRKTQANAKDWHHIIDPLTLQPALTDVRLVTVCADSAVVADVLASCAVITGSKSAGTFVKSRGAKRMLLQADNDSGSFQKQFGRFIMRESAEGVMRQ